MWDWDAVSTDDFLGMIEIPLISFTLCHILVPRLTILSDGLSREIRYVLEPRESDEKTSGDIHLVTQLQAPGTTTSLQVGQVPNLRPLVHLGNGQLIVEGNYLNFLSLIA